MAASRKWFRDEPFKVADNLYIFATNGAGIDEGLGGVSAWAITTSDGIVLIDTTYDHAVRDTIDLGMRKVGLNPADIKDVFITHGHGDHYGGAKYLQDTYHPNVYAAEGEWEYMPEDVGNLKQPIPRKDKIVGDGQTITRGDTTLTVYRTPGHSPGTLSFLFPVKIGGQTHMAAFWGGTALANFVAFQEYSSSATRFAEIARRERVDIMLSNHDAYGDYFKKIAQMKANPQGPNPFIVGVDAVQRYLQVLDHCGQAQGARRAAATAPSPVRP